MKHPTLTFVEAIRQATHQAMAADDRVIVVGEGVPDPKGIFGTTIGLQEAFGHERVMDMPLSEEGVTGAMIGAAIRGLRPILTHQRVDFALLSLNQIINNAAKWEYIFNGTMKVPLVIRMAIGMGWGQGAQHSQSLHSLFAHIPGLKVVMPTTPADAKGLLLAAVRDDTPVIFLEHRWLHGSKGPVPVGDEAIPIGPSRVVRKGRDVTIVATGYCVVDALQAAEALAANGVDVEIIDPRTIRPFDAPTTIASVRRTGRLVVVDCDWSMCGFSAEVVATVAESCLDCLRTAPIRVTWPDQPVPSSPALAEAFYPRARQIADAVCQSMGRVPIESAILDPAPGEARDVPHPSFTGPF